MTFNLGTHDFTKNTGEWMTVVDAEGNDTDAKLKLLPMQSQEYKNAKKNASKEVLKATKGKTEKNTKPEDLAALEEIAEKVQIDLLAAITVDVEGLVWGDGSPVEAKDAAKLYNEHNWIAQQANEFVGVQANFIMKPSSK